MIPRSTAPLEMRLDPFLELEAAVVRPDGQPSYRGLVGHLPRAKGDIMPREAIERTCVRGVKGG